MNYIAGQLVGLLYILSGYLLCVIFSFKSSKNNKTKLNLNLY